MRKPNSNNKDGQFSGVKFCTECCEELKNFSMTGKASDGKSAKERFHECQKSGKFQGEICARLFIADFKEEDLPKGEENLFPNEDEP
ncbi:MAG TPA: hypothetical protein VHO03_08130 [Ignavibacteriales bacterium]|nr:hypothetical protein [Ignavibacteriales bacterium]